VRSQQRYLGLNLVFQRLRNFPSKGPSVGIPGHRATRDGVLAWTRQFDKDNRPQQTRLCVPCNGGSVTNR
jgi:hypothetical protein